jgi:D-aminoacyl-tRNA deacylase
MRAVVQRVNSAKVAVSNKTTGQIQKGLLVYLGIAKHDQPADLEYICDKLANLRIFKDENDKMNLNVRDINGSILLVSQFTLLGDCRKGRRPGFDFAAEPKMAEKLYNLCAEKLRNTGLNVSTGIFGAYMHVESINDGPVTFLLDSSKIL